MFRRRGYHSPGSTSTAKPASPCANPTASASAEVCVGRLYVGRTFLSAAVEVELIFSVLGQEVGITARHKRNSADLAK